MCGERRILKLRGKTLRDEEWRANQGGLSPCQTVEEPL